MLSKLALRARLVILPTLISALVLGSAVRLGLRRSDELGQLAQEFERIAAQIAQSHSQLEDPRSPASPDAP